MTPRSEIRFSLQLSITNMVNILFFLKMASDIKQTALILNYLK